MPQEETTTPIKKSKIGSQDEVIKKEESKKSDMREKGKPEKTRLKSIPVEDRSQKSIMNFLKKDSQ